MAEDTNTKVVRLETQMANVDEKIDKITVKIDRIESKLDTISDLRQEMQSLKDAHSEHVRYTDQKMRDIVDTNNKEIKEIKGRNFTKGWLYPTLSAIVGSSITFLIIEYLRSK